MKFLLPLLAILFLPFAQARADAPYAGVEGSGMYTTNTYELRTARPARYSREEQLRRDYRAFQREQAEMARYRRAERVRAARIAEERSYRRERRLSPREARRREAIALAEENRRYERQRRRYAETRAERRLQDVDDDYNRESGAMCKSVLTATGPIRKGRARAEEAARQVWQAEVARAYSSRYASTRRAQGKRYSCDDVPGSWLGQSCRFRARPCRAEF